MRCNTVRRSSMRSMRRSKSRRCIVADSKLVIHDGVQLQEHRTSTEAMKILERLANGRSSCARRLEACSQMAASRATSFLTNGAHVALFAAMAAVVLTQEIMTRETAQTNHATPTHPRRASLVTQSAKSRIEMLAPQPLHFRNVLQASVLHRIHFLGILGWHSRCRCQ